MSNSKSSRARFISLDEKLAIVAASEKPQPDGFLAPIDDIAGRFKVSTSYVYRLLRNRDELVNQQKAEAQQKSQPQSTASSISSAWQSSSNTPSAYDVFNNNQASYSSGYASQSSFGSSSEVVDPDVLEMVRILKERNIVV